MIKIFKQNIILQLAIILIVVVALWWPAFAMPVTMNEANCEAPVFGLVYEWLAGSPFLASGLALVLVLIEGLLINEMVYTNKMLGQGTLLPMMVYVMAMSLGRDNLTITPMVMVNLWLILSLHWALSKSNLTISSGDLFGVAAMVAIATLCYVPAIWLIVPMLLLIPTYKLYSWRDWMQMILGLLAPMIPVLVWWFWKGSLTMHAANMLNGLTEWCPELTTDAMAWVASGVWLLIALVVYVDGLSAMGEQTLQLQKSATVIVLPVIAGLIMISYGRILPLNMQAMAVSLAYYVTTYAFSIKRRAWMFDVAVIVAVVMGVMMNF